MTRLIVGLVPVVQQAALATDTHYTGEQARAGCADFRFVPADAVGSVNVSGPAEDCAR